MGALRRRHSSHRRGARRSAGRPVWQRWRVVRYRRSKTASSVDRYNKMPPKHRRRGGARRKTALRSRWCSSTARATTTTSSSGRTGTRAQHVGARGQFSDEGCSAGRGGEGGGKGGGRRSRSGRRRRGGEGGGGLHVHLSERTSQAIAACRLWNGRGGPGESTVGYIHRVTPCCATAPRWRTRAACSRSRTPTASSRERLMPPHVPRRA